MKEKDEISETKDTIEEGAGSPDTGEESKTDPGAGRAQRAVLCRRIPSVLSW